MTFIIGLIALGILVFLHECGHFIAARISGVKVEAFSIGMGPVILHKTIKGVDYRISLIPLGGYCAMKGDNDFKEALDSNLPVISGDKDSFYGTHPLKRLFIAFAGPLTNLITGFLFFTIIAIMGYSYWTTGNKIFLPSDINDEIRSTAQEAGILSGDKIIEINGKKITYFHEIAEFISVHPDEYIDVKIDRDGTILDLNVYIMLDADTGSGKIGIYSDKDNPIKLHYGVSSFSDAIAEGFKQTVQFVNLTFKSIRILFKGINLTKALSGPVRISNIMGSTVTSGYSSGFHTGTVSTLEILAVISISLFFTNMLPLPVLDGGLILFALIEWISRRKLNPKVQLYIQYSGIVLIAILMGIVLTSDFMFLLNK